jgi:iron complex outermembrane receptor protein
MILTAKQRLTAGFWYQVTDRQIPPTMTMVSSDQVQWDQAIRSSLQWTYVGQKQAYNVNAAYIDEKEHYTTETANIDAFYHLNTFQGSFDYKRHFRKPFVLGTGATSHLTKADVPYYQQIRYQNDLSLWLALSFSGLKSGLISTLNLRQDFSEGYKIPFCPALNLEVPLGKRFKTNYAVSRNYRIPSMNDKYWIPGGNPDLKPENSWNFEIGASFGFMKTKYSKSDFHVNFYSNFINDFIQWVPGEANIWSPYNLSKVWSRGVEITSKSDWTLYGFSGYFTFGYNYSPSTYQGGVENTGDQLIYTPLHKISEVFYVSKEKYFALISYSYTSLRYVVSDNSKSLPGYSLLNMQTGYNFILKKSKFRIQFEINNLLNTEYQSAQYYPEPGRSYAIKLLYTNN